MEKIKTERIKITKKIREKLKNERKSTGVGYSSLLRGSSTKELYSMMIGQWASGKVKTAKKNYVDAVFELYSNLPTVKMVELSKETSTLIRNKIKETNLTLDCLLSLRDDVPKGLQAKSFHRNLQRKKEYNKIWGDYILGVCNQYIEKKEAHEQVKGSYHSLNELPVKKKATGRYMSLREGLVSIPKDALDTIKQRAKTIDSMFNSMFEHKKVPEGLNKHMVKNWIYGTAKTANPKHVQWVLKESERLLKNTRIELTDERREALRKQSERTAIGATQFLDQVQGKPEGISVGMISGWLNGPTKTARKDYYDFVLREWERL